MLVYQRVNGVFLGHIPFYDTAISPPLPLPFVAGPRCSGQRNSLGACEEKWSNRCSVPRDEGRLLVSIWVWLVVWNMSFIVPYNIGKNNPNWLIFFQRGWNHQPGVCLKMGYSHGKPWKFGGNQWERTKNWGYFLVIMTSTIYDLVPWLAQFGESRRGVRWFPSHVYQVTSSTAQGTGGSFKNRKPIGEVGCCESRMAERSHWWIERWLRSPLILSLSLSLIICLPTYRSIYRSIYPSIHPSIYSIYLSI